MRAPTSKTLFYDRDKDRLFISTMGDEVERLEGPGRGGLPAPQAEAHAVNSVENRIRGVAERLRDRLEGLLGRGDRVVCFEGRCGRVSRLVVQEFRRQGLDAELVSGNYIGASEDFWPDTSKWAPEDVEWLTMAAEHESVADIPFPHWWVAVEGHFVDLTADQFHPGQEERYRVVVVPDDDVRYESYLEVRGRGPDYPRLTGAEREVLKRRLMR